MGGKRLIIGIIIVLVILIGSSIIDINLFKDQFKISTPLFSLYLTRNIIEIGIFIIGFWLGIKYIQSRE